MTEAPANVVSRQHDDDEMDVYTIATVVLRHRRLLSWVAALGFGLGLASGLTSPRVYKSTATFIPQGGQGPSSGLAQAASQFGFSVASGGGAWSPQMYVELIGSRGVLLPIVLDTFTVPEEGGRRGTLVDLLGVTAPSQDRRALGAVKILGKMIQATENRRIGGVTLSVVSPWPSVSLAVAERLIRRVDQFNIETRRSQAVAELQFVEGQVAESEAALRDAEDKLQSFLQGNRDVSGSPRLGFERDRLQREVTRLNQLYTSWLQSREDARIRAVRDTPVITVLEDPLFPYIREPRKSAQKAMVGGVAGLVIGALVAAFMEWLAYVRKRPSEQAREFFQVLREAAPGFLRRRHVG